MIWDWNENFDLDTFVSYKKDNPLPGLILNFQISFEHLHEAAHMLCKPLPLSVWIKQLRPYTRGCKTQITLISKNIFKAPGLSSYMIDSKNSWITK